MSTRPIISPADRSRDPGHALRFVRVDALFRPEAPASSRTLALVCEGIGRLLGDAPGELSIDRRTLPRAVVERLVDRLSHRTYGGQFTLRPGEVLSSGVLGALRSRSAETMRYARHTGAGVAYRPMWHVSWATRPPLAELSLVLCEADVLKEQFQGLRAFVRALFEALAGEGAVYARARRYAGAALIAPSGLPTGDVLVDLEYPCAARDAERGPALARAVAAGYQPEAGQLTLLDGSMLRRLGGRAAFEREVRQLNLDHLWAQPIGPSHLLVIADKGELPNRSSNARSTMAVEAAEHDLMRLFAGHGALFWHAPRDTVHPADEPDSTRASATPRPRIDLPGWVHAHPPRCVAGVGVAPRWNEIRSIERDWGPHAVGFVVARKGKHDVPVRVWGRRRKDLGVPLLVPPVLIGGPTRREASFTFDPLVDGWHGEFRGGGVSSNSGVRPWLCRSCGHDRFTRAIAVFQYADEDQELDDPEHLARVQDFFSWFALRLTCGGCRRTETPCEHECA